MKIIMQKDRVVTVVCAAAIILFALVVRVLLMAVGWPLTDSDEGLIGLQAMHIAYQAEHPTFLYGQHYMGTIQPYLASGIFHLFGVSSSFTLRFSTLILFGCFLCIMYLLTRLLYTRAMALFVLLLLSLGTQFMFTPQIMVEGGVVETLVFASVLMLISTRLALTHGKAVPGDRRLWRLALYGCWGLAAGAAVWSDYLIFPWLLGASLLLVTFCWREWRSAGFVCLLIGFVIGALPIIIYNLHPAPGQNFFEVIWTLQHSSVPGSTIDAFTRWKQFIGTFLYGIPIMSGLVPVCSLGTLPGFGGHVVSMCSLFNGSWGMGYVVLILLAIVLSTLALRDLIRRYRAQSGTWSPEDYRTTVMHVARLMLLLSVILTIALYALSPISGQRPWSTRYLTCIFIAMPALLWPLWSGMGSVPFLFKQFSSRMVRALSIFRYSLIGLILLSSLVSTIMITQAVPATVAAKQQQYQLIPDLLSRHITHIYSEYWTCGRIMFQSQEKIICAVVDNQVHPSHNRYEPYGQTVVADTAHATYIFPVGSAYVDTCAKLLSRSSIKYQRLTFDNYVVFVPV